MHSSVLFSGESPLVVALEQCKSVQMELPGIPRRNKVRLPSCILSSKPPNVPNQQVELRKHHMTSIAFITLFCFLYSVVHVIIVATTKPAYSQLALPVYIKVKWNVHWLSVSSASSSCLSRSPWGGGVEPSPWPTQMPLWGASNWRHPV